MMDVHCHLEQEDYSNDRDYVIEKCREKLKCVVSSAANYSDFKSALEIHKKYPDFVFLSLGLHPIYVKEITEAVVKRAMKFIKENKNEIVAIGEVGLDYYHVKEKRWQNKQEALFRKFIKLAQELNLPLVVHCRDAFEDAIRILEEEKAEKVLMHLFGDKQFIQRVLENKWFISVGPIVARSKTIKKIVKFTPIKKIMLETDSPWFGFGERGTPMNVLGVAEKIAEIKKITSEEVDEQTDLNATGFFGIGK